MYVYLLIFLGLLLVGSVIAYVRSKYSVSTCKPNCTDCNKTDGCGGSCACLSGLVCTKEGTCCTPNCSKGGCGDDGCGGSCGTCESPATCINGQCCTPNCVGKNCGDDGCGGTCGDPKGCPNKNDVCKNGVCECVKQCTGKQCGDDGCGGTCGVCDAPYHCDNGLCVCKPNCDGKNCGDDGCKGSCGTCKSNEKCDNGKCECVPDCGGRVCGDNGCGGTCGTCRENESCSPDQTKCVCIPHCDTNSCNVSDGCGGICACPSGLCGSDKKCCPLSPGCNDANGCKCSKTGDICYNGACCTPKNNGVCVSGFCGSLGCGLADCDCSKLGTNYTCKDNKCVCKETCGDRKCGFDACGNSCGICNASGFKCNSGSCDYVGPKLLPGSYNFHYTDPNTKKTSCLVMGTTFEGSGGWQPRMIPLDANGNCTPTSDDITLPPDLHWNYDGSNLIWHSDLGTMTKHGRSGKYCDTTTCITCPLRDNPLLCSEIHGADLCSTDSYTGGITYSMDYSGSSSGQNMEVIFGCPPGVDCTEALCPGGNCRPGQYLVPRDNELGQLIVSDKNDRTAGWKPVPFNPPSASFTFMTDAICNDPDNPHDFRRK